MFLLSRIDFGVVLDEELVFDCRVFLGGSFVFMVLLLVKICLILFKYGVIVLFLFKEGVSFLCRVIDRI